MKKLLITLAISALFLAWACSDYHQCEFNEQDSTLKCSDGVYKTVKLDGRNWFQENSRFYTDFSYCYKGDFKLCNDYGRLYTWEASRKVCPLGWHVPTKLEVESLVALGDFEKLNIPKAGFRYRGDDYVDLDVSVRMWLDNEFDEARAYMISIENDEVKIEHFNKDIAASVRCVQN